MMMEDSLPTHLRLTVRAWFRLGLLDAGEEEVATLPEFLTPTDRINQEGPSLAHQSLPKRICSYMRTRLTVFI